MAEPRKHEKYDARIYACHALAPVRTAVVHPCGETSLAGAVEAAEAKIIKPILVGPQAMIRLLAASLGGLDGLISLPRLGNMRCRSGLAFARMRRGSAFGLMRWRTPKADRGFLRRARILPPGSSRLKKTDDRAPHAPSP